VTDKQLLTDCLAFLHNDCEVLQGRHTSYLSLEARLVEAIERDDALVSRTSTTTITMPGEQRMDAEQFRDMMAASLVLPADISRATGRALVGPEPRDGLKLIKWWAAAKARLRYIEVDAMMEARK